MNQVGQARLVARTVPALAVGMAGIGHDQVPVAAETLSATAAMAPNPDHVVIVIPENKQYDAVVGHPRTPWVSSLAKTSANLRDFYAETHPSQPPDSNPATLPSGTCSMGRSPTF
jgi:hypothetical protein